MQEDKRVHVLNSVDWYLLYRWVGGRCC